MRLGDVAQTVCMEAMVRTMLRLDAEQRQLSLFGTIVE
jgi:hypothetical protein